ncbi:efflux RND transporter permease subunit [Myxococcota bacterium]|nr:efflux RND transporter permease subunit [Myxococcota bacterium]
MNGAIDWFARNHVAANLLMLGILLAGLLSVPTIRQTIFPDVKINYASVTVVYPGASPTEVERSVTVRIEEKIQDVEGIEEIRSSSNEGAASVILEIDENRDMGRTLDEIKSRVDSIVTFPEEAEKPIIQEILFRSTVLDLAIFGDADERTLKEIGQKVRDEIADLPGISQVDLSSTRPYEISIEVSENSLRRHDLRFDDVVNAVRRSSIDVPGGSIKTDGGEILLRTEGQAYHGSEFESLPILTRRDGSRVTVGQVAGVVDGFHESDNVSRFDGQPAVFVQVHRVGNQNALDVSREVHRYLETARTRLPAGVQMTVWDDDSRYLSDRINMMLRNAAGGFVLVLMLLAVFLKLRVAFWVAVGVPVSIAGGLALMPQIGLDINILTVFAFIMALGILVDDAIVTGENIYTHLERDPEHPLRASILGTQEVATPVVFGVLTTIAAFAPFSFIGGHAKVFSTSISGVMMAALVFSLVESKLVLPAHLAHASGVGAIPKGRISVTWATFQRGVARQLADFLQNRYRPAVERCIEWRYLTLAVAVSIFTICMGIGLSGHLRFSLMPSMQSDNVWARLTMPYGTPASTTWRALQQLETSAQTLASELGTDPRGEHIVRHVFVTLGSHHGTSSPFRRPGGSGESHFGQINLELMPAEARGIDTEWIKQRWREITGPIPGAEELTFLASFRQFGDPIDIELRGADIAETVSAAEALKTALAAYPGVKDVRDSFQEGKKELKLRILPLAESAGLSLQDLGRQVRQAFYGAEVQRIQRGRDEVKVMVRLPESDRRSLSDIENMRIRLPDGTAVPFTSVAAAEMGRGYSSIARRQRKRSVSVTADIDSERANANEVLADLQTNALPGILAAHPGISISLEGEQREQRKALNGLKIGSAAAMFMIFTLLAIPLRSYTQPLIIMAAIPFGYVGAVIGHLLMDRELSLLSMTGVLACAGVVVNDSLVLVTFFNRLRERGIATAEAATQAGIARFRAIMLTSLTTFAGLTPIMLEQSVQAQFVIPMAVSLAFGVLVATFFTLLLIPAMTLIVEDIRNLFAPTRRPNPTETTRMETQLG